MLAQHESAEADRYLAQLVAVAQDAHADVREYILGARTGLSAEAGFLSALTQYLQRFSQNYGIAAETECAARVKRWGLRANGRGATAAHHPGGAHEREETRAGAPGARQPRVLLTAAPRRSFRTTARALIPTLLETAEGQKFGLRFMRERAAEVGGSVQIHSAPGEGTQVIICVPLRKDEDRHEGPAR